MHTTAWARLSVQLQGAEHTAHSAEFTFSLWHPGVEIYTHIRKQIKSSWVIRIGQQKGTKVVLGNILAHLYYYNRTTQD